MRESTWHYGRAGKPLTTLVYGDQTYMVLSNSSIATIRAAIVAQDKFIDPEHLALYKELGIEPAMFGYTFGNWEYWEQQHSSLTLTSAEREQLKAAIVSVAALNRPLPNSSYTRARLSVSSQTILSKIGLSPISLGLSNATDWKNY